MRCGPGSDTDRADRSQPDDRRHHQRDPGAERAGRGRPHRRPPDLERPAAAAQHPDQGAPDLGRRVREDRHPHQPGRIGAAAGATSRGWNWAPPISIATRASTAAPRRSIAIYQSPGANAIATLKAVRAQLAKLQKRFPGRSGLEGHLRPDHLRHRHDPRGAEDADRGLRPGGDRRLPVPRQRPRDADPDARRAGQPHRHLHRPQCDRLFGQHRLACSPSCSPSASSSTMPSSSSRTSSA